MKNLDFVNYTVYEKDVWCDDIDKDDKGDRGDLLTRLTGRQGLQDNGLHWDLMGSTQLSWWSRWYRWSRWNRWNR